MLRLAVFVWPCLLSSISITDHADQRRSAHTGTYRDKAYSCQESALGLAEMAPEAPRGLIPAYNFRVSRAWALWQTFFF